ncbi:MAG: HAD family phosphatase [Lactobacillus sp.]|nr:HAD family phosphatase [Lactobacillus sp.]
MYKLIACDLDETLLSDDVTISQRNIDAIKAALNKGIKFVPATGRGYNSIQNVLNDLDLKDKASEYVISFNGGCITENKDNRIIKFTGLEYSEVKALFQIGREFDVCIHVNTKNKLFIYNANDDELNYVMARNSFEVIKDPDDLSFLKNEDVAKVIYGNTDLDYLSRIEKVIREKGYNLDISYSSNRYLELNPQGVNKGQGLHELAANLDIDLADTIAIGDNFNDLSMIKTAGLGVGMKNVNPKIKQYCDFITNSDNNEGGVGEVIEKFILDK